MHAPKPGLRALARMCASRGFPPALGSTLMAGLVKRAAAESFVVLLGPPGVGKGTTVSYLKTWLSGTSPRESFIEDFAMSGVLNEYWSTGELAPDVIERLRATCARGDLVEDRYVKQAVDWKLSMIREGNGGALPKLVMPDGAIRSVPQFDFFREVSASYGRRLVVVRLDASRHTCIARMQQRALHENRPDNGKEEKRIDTYFRDTLPAGAVAASTLGKWNAPVVKAESNNKELVARRALAALLLAVGPRCVPT